ncbi:LpxL/LpxP family Kdo(2)-lipid IV(A) lauroyl/palmitoleoyl acyltransferase [Candidatus Blochmannia ocreatus (nom. nud.)]|uniref:Lipid A biosynthesis acyltransferase n=1 Tax=Candidatus Blochmannia ocreatus (nom. nud.) TaxID=251538 RepID=A0ABY4SV84_9ENTR|nr:LpxL/LpxP family Kdo(2)-lipid IV(A) lauroyl/palmitoleoyl acyltransferase [Candidatus Blochmannia ocreatus]URJ24915.1 LpxL/LpxP family Kdo(2)-lipid IV(A) lauroyl/palmitoleoyl acyltransferase [Candidatus Blochmannia ocreatus]
MHKIPKFHYYFLHPKFWLIWIGIGILYVIVSLPYSVIYYLGIRLGRMTKYFLLHRMHIIKRNLDLCFPNLSTKEKKDLFNKNCESIGMGVLETGMAWFWSEHRIKRWFKIKGLKNITQARKNKTGILLIGIHFLTLELGARILGTLNPGIGVYRPNDNPLLDWIQTKGRLRSNKKMLICTNVTGMIKALKNGEIVWYAPDHDYGRKNSVFVPLFAVPKAASTIGTYILTKIAKPALIPFIARRLPNSFGYELIIFPNKKNEVPLNTSTDMIKYINKIIEQIILLAPDQYMWLHRRFKTRPPGEPYLY